MYRNGADYEYLFVLNKILTKGVYREGRNGGTYGLFGEQMRFDLSEGLPVLTTKRVFTKAIIVELLWFLKGDTNIKYLKDHNVDIWDEWADEDGNLGPVYGSQWRKWETPAAFGEGVNIIDQITNVIEGIKKDPYGRRHIVTAWNPGEIGQMKLPPCHCLFQFHVANGKLSCHLYQRSADWFLGVPFNMVSYAILTYLVARECGLQVGDFIHSFGDLHVYANHVEQCKLQLSREDDAFPNLPTLSITDERSIFELEPKDIDIIGYECHPAIKAEVSK